MSIFSYEYFPSEFINSFSGKDVQHYKRNPKPLLQSLQFVTAFCYQDQYYFGGSGEAYKKANKPIMHFLSKIAIYFYLGNMREGEGIGKTDSSGMSCCAALN